MPYLIVAVVVLSLFSVVIVLKALQLEWRLTEKTKEKNTLFEDNQNLVSHNQKLSAQNKELIAENTKWRDRVTNAENSRDKAQQHSISADAKMMTMRQELNAAQALARSVEIEVDREKRIKELETGIAAHRAAKGHDRCWENDLKLYQLVGGTIDENVMPPLPEFMHNCAAYYQGQCRKVESPTAAESKDAAVS